MNLRELLFLHAASGGGGSLVENTATGNPVAFNTNVAKPLKSVVVPLSYTQAGSGDPSPSNVRSITGVSSFTFTHNDSAIDVAFPALGKNLFDKSTGIELLEKNILVARNDGYGVPIHMKAGVTYYVYVNAGTNPNEISLRVPYQATTIYVKYTSNTGYLVYTPEEDVDVAINVYWINGRPEEATDLMVETGSKTSYEPYNNSVYGGSLDLVSGVLTLTHQMLSTTWGAGTNSKEFTTNERRRFEFPVGCVSAGSAGILSRSNIAPYLWEYDADSVHFYNNNLYSYMFLPIGTSDSTELQIVGKLATPITVQLTPAQVSAFVGENTVWTNTTGDLTIKYLYKA